MVHRRIVPIAWFLMPQQESWDQGQWDIVERLFAQVAPLLTDSVCTLLADRGLSSLPLVKLCQRVGWHYVLRIQTDEQFRKKKSVVVSRMAARQTDRGKARGSMVWRGAALARA